MESRSLGWLPRSPLIILGSALLAWAMFSLTAWSPVPAYLGPLCASNDIYPGFDPWTGRPHGRIYDSTADCWTDQPGPVTRVVGDVPDELLGRRVITIPVGFAIGLAVMLGAFLIMDFRRRGPSAGAETEVTIPV